MAELDQIAKLDLRWRGRTAAESGIYCHQRDYKTLVDVSQTFVAHSPEECPGHYFSLSVTKVEASIPMPSLNTGWLLSCRTATRILSLDWHALTPPWASELMQRRLSLTFYGNRRENYISPYRIGTVYAGLGNKEKAFEFLEKTYLEKSRDIPYFLKTDLRLDTLRSDPRFQDLLRRVGLSQ